MVLSVEKSVGIRHQRVIHYEGALDIPQILVISGYDGTYIMELAEPIHPKTYPRNEVVPIVSGSCRRYLRRSDEGKRTRGCEDVECRVTIDMLVLPTKEDIELYDKDKGI